MNKKILTIVATSFILLTSVFVAVLYSAPFSVTVKSYQCLVFGFLSKNVNIADGEFIADIRVTIKGLEKTSGAADDLLYINWISKQNEGFEISEDTSYIPNSPSNLDVRPSPEDPNFKIIRVVKLPTYDYGMKLGQYKFSTRNRQDLSISLSNVNNPQDSIWSVYSNPCEITIDGGAKVNLTSGVLNGMDSIGANKSFGILIVPEGTSSYKFDKIMIDLIIKSYNGINSNRTIHIESNRKPMIF